MEFLSEFFSGQTFMPHGMCYLWKPGLVALEVVSNALIGLSYLAISTTLTVLVYRLRDIPFKVMYLAFGLFIVTCGLTHFLDIWVIWFPIYWVDGFVRAVTAAASVGTAIALPALVPRAITLVRASRVAQRRGLQVEGALRDLGTSLERAKQLDELKSTLFANVSHELRTPLQLILGPASALVRGTNLTDAQRRDIDTIIRNARLLLKQVNDLLDVARLEAGKTNVDYETTDVAQLLRVVARNFDAHAHSREMSWQLDIPAIVHAQVDVTKVERVLLNLLSNAFKFTPAGGTVRLALRQESSQLFIDVEDSGPGVALEQQRVIFERFRQGDEKLTRQHGGTGLGLAIVKDFVELLGGSVGVAASTLGGARFTVRLPQEAPTGAMVRPESPVGEDWDSAAARETLEELKVVPERVRPASTVKGPRVLVVEDNPEVREFIVHALPADYQVTTAADGAEGLSAAARLEPDLVVTDVMMPGMSGDALLAAIRAEPRLDATPVLLLSARAEEEFRAKLLGEGAQDYLTKPFAAEEFRARATNLVSMKRVRDRLQEAVASRNSDVEALAVQLTEHQGRLEVALGEMRAARDVAKRANQFKGEFLGLVAHELRTPVSALQLQLQRLDVEMNRTGAPSVTLQRIATSISRLTTLIDSLLEYARGESGRLSTSVVDFSVADVAREAIEELRPSAERKGIELRFAPETGLPTLRSDPRLVRLILSNLLANAVKFTDTGGVEVLLRRGPDGQQVLAVRDTGPGIRPEDQKSLFEPFMQLETTRALQQTGVGLGLALVRAMASALGGNVWLDSEVGRGSTFSVAIPPTSNA
jgi:signal transduction histidine kinase